MLQFSTTPLSIRKVWKTSYKLARARFIPLYFLIVLQYAWIFLPQMFYVNNDNLSVNSLQAHEWLFAIYYFISTLIGFFISALLIHQMGTFMQGSMSRFADSMRVAYRKFPTMLWAFVLTFLMALVGLVALVLPGIFLVVALFVTSPFIVLDNLTAVGAIKQSIRVTWGRWWRSFAVVVTAMFVPLVVIALFSIGVMLVGRFLHITRVEHAILANLLQLILTPIAGLYLVAVLVVQWHDLKVRYHNKQLIKSTIAS